MATTGRPWEILVTGIKDSSGVAVASGKVRWYNPGTLVAATAYSDAALTSAITAPLVLNAQGQGALYFLEPVRVIVKDTTETTTYYDDIPALNRHDSVYVTHPSYNSGAETTLEAILTTAATGLGTGFQYKESSTATARNYVDWLGETHVSVKDFGAVGDGVADDTVAAQAASDRVETRGGGWVLWPTGTYKITSAITIDTVGVCHRGNGRKSIIKNFSTTGSVFSINVGSAIDSKIVLKDLAITANTTSSGAAITAANGNRIRVENVAVALHRGGIALGAITEGRVHDCIVESTDDNAAAVGMALGTRGRADHCQLISGTTNGTGINLAGDARAVDCYVEKFATGYSLNTAGAQVRGCVSSLATTSYTLAAAGTQAEASLASGAVTGFSVGAFAACGVPFCRASACTTDLSVNASATLFDDRGASFAGTVTDSAASPAILPLRTFFSSSTTASTSPTFTPDISGGKNAHFLLCTAGTTVTLTIANHATATLAIGDWFILTVQKTGTANVNFVWGTQYDNVDGTAVGNAGTISVTTLNQRAFGFQWNGSAFIRVWMTENATA